MRTRKPLTHLYYSLTTCLQSLTSGCRDNGNEISCTDHVVWHKISSTSTQSWWSCNVIPWNTKLTDMIWSRAHNLLGKIMSDLMSIYDQFVGGQLTSICTPWKCHSKCVTFRGGGRHCQNRHFRNVKNLVKFVTFSWKHHPKQGINRESIGTPPPPTVIPSSRLGWSFTFNV
jgi:hypothetical protein